MRSWLAGAVALLVPSIAAAETSWLFFGDSLVDNQNSFAFTSRIFGPANAIPASPPYFDGRFSNGPNWTDRLAPDQGTYFSYFFSDPGCTGGGVFPPDLCDAGLDPGTQPGRSQNFAFGGARSGLDTLPQAPGFLTIVGDVESYVTSGRLARPEDHAIGLLVGGNDVSAYAAAALSGTATETAEALAIRVVDNIQQGLARLAALGPDRAVVLNLEDLARVPTFIEVFGAEGAALAGAAGTLVNAELKARLPAIEAASGLDIVPVDTNALYEEFFADPALFGITNLTQGCIAQGNGAPTGACPTPEAEAGSIYWDGTHPTTTAHGYVAELVRATLQVADSDPGRLAAAQDAGILQAGFAMAALRSHLADPHRHRHDSPAALAIGFHHRGERAARTGFSGYEHSTLGGLAGLEASVELAGQAWRLGLHAGYATLDADVEGGGSFDLDTIVYGGHATTRLGRFDIAAQLSGLSLEIDDQRRPTGFSVLPVARSETDGQGFAGEVEGSLELGRGSVLSLRPLLRLSGAHLSLDGFRETGARFLDLEVGDAELSSLDLGIGIRAGLKAPEAAWRPHVELTYTRALIDDERALSVNLPSGFTSTTSAEAATTDSLAIEGGVSWAPRPDLVLALSAGGGFAPGGGDNHFTAPRLRLVKTF